MSLEIVHETVQGRIYVSRLTRLTCLSIVQVHNFGPGTLRFSKQENELLNQPSDPVKGGIQVSVADGIKEFHWIGDMYVTATANDTNASVQIHPVAQSEV